MAKIPRDQAGNMRQKEPWLSQEEIVVVRATPVLSWRERLRVLINGKIWVRFVVSPKSGVPSIDDPLAQHSTGVRAAADIGVSDMKIREIQVDASKEIYNPEPLQRRTH